MAITNAIEHFEMTVNEAFVRKAMALAPKLIETMVKPVRTVNIVPNGEDYAVREAAPNFTASLPMGRDDSICLDFGDHQVGYVSFSLTPVGSPAAALDPGTTRTAVDGYYDYLQSQLLFPILGDPNRCILESGWFYDSNFHLNASGATVFTKLLAEDIKLWLEDTSPTDILLPVMPIPPVTEIRGDDSHAHLFTYRREEGGWIAEGLTDEGLAAAELIVPTHYQGEPVVGMDPNLFVGNTHLARLTLQPNVGMLYDGMFRGCTALEELILTGERPSDYAVGDGLMEGARFMIYVPDTAIDSYRRDYFWQVYDAWLLPREP